MIAHDSATGNAYARVGHVPSQHNAGDSASMQLHIHIATCATGMCVQMQLLTLECQTLHLAVQVVRRRRSGCWCRQHQRTQDECYESCHDPNRRHRDLTNVNVRGWLPLSGPYCDAGLFRQTHHSPNWQQQRTWRVCVCLRAEQRAADTYV
jgi:hypothetical protein